MLRTSFASNGQEGPGEKQAGEALSVSVGNCEFPASGDGLRPCRFRIRTFINSDP